MEAHRSYERFEQHRELFPGEHPHHARNAALLVAVIAACLAVATFLSNEAVKEVVTGETHWADASARLETNKVKIDLAEGNETMLRVLGKGSAGEDAAAVAAGRHEAHLVEELRPADAHLQAEISDREADVDHADTQHLDYEIAEIGLEVGIVLASVSIIARRRWLLGAAGAAATVGVALVLIGLVLV
jgi:hypothetical protein